MPKINKASNDYISRLQDAIRRINGCESRYLETVTISESFQGFQEKAPWEGEVVVFEIFGHPKANVPMLGPVFLRMRKLDTLSY
jgi:hypothetical protein